MTVTTTATNLEVLSDLTNETLEWEFTNEKLGGFLITTNLTKSNGTRAEPVGLLHATSCSLNGLNQPSARDHNSDDDDGNIDVDDGKINIHTAAAVLRAALVAELLTSMPCLDIGDGEIVPITKFPRSGARLRPPGVDFAVSGRLLAIND